MTGGRLQTLLDTVRATSRQRWLLVVVAISAPLTASALIAAESGRLSSGTVGLVCLLAGVAIAAAAYPDAHTGLVIIGIIAWQWIASVDNAANVRSVAVALCLVAMHSALALMAVTPYTAVVERSVLRRTAGRAADVFVPTVLVWLIVVAFDGVNRPGDAFLAFLALSTVVVGVIALRAVGGRDGPRNSS